ncbi:MAG: DNA-processing protein DprA [Bryobacteraceae bacterium]
MLAAAALTKDEEISWLALLLVSGLGPRRSVPLVRQFGSIQSIFRASTGDLLAAGIPGSAAQSIASGCTFEDALDQRSLMDRCGAVLIPVQDPRYPAALKEIFDPPLVLFARGRTELLQKSSIAVVGTRRPSPYGIAATERLSKDLASKGLVITSGMARGIDTAAHKAALAVAGETIAVFGSGVDHIYPAENRKLSEEISTKGLLLSEFPMGNPGHPQNFPIRNRIISGLSVGVLIVEGAQYSGSAITATMAMEQGREVFAVPGNITSKMSWAPNLLIKQGAKLVQDAEDVLAELSPEVRRKLTTPKTEEAGNESAEIERALGPKAPLASEILKELRVEEATQADELLDRLSFWPPSEIVATLFEMQLLGLVRQLPGRRYVKEWHKTT